MQKNIAQHKENLKEKLSYIGLNLEKIPKFLTEFTPFSFRPSRAYNDSRYKIYKYIDVSDIQILLTPTDRLTNLSERYKLASPILKYLDSKTEENMEYFTTFLKLLNDTEIEDIEKLEKKQESMSNNIPHQVKYEGNYGWQIYYSDVSDKYFMLVPTNEYNNASLFYLLKKQIQAKKSRKKENIYVPISYQDYSGSFLVKSQITDLENYLWYFTSDWPEIYEVYDKKNKMELKIVGKTKVYEKITSDYVITLDSKEKAQDFFKTVKALFILSTALPESYSFKTTINNEGEIDLVFEEQVITYDNLLIFIQNQASIKKMIVELEDKKVIKEQEKLQELKVDVESLTQEYLSKQRQIATFLECKKSFFGKVKYYFSNRKKEPKPVVSEEPAKNKKGESKIQDQEVQQEDGAYTIEDLITICTKLNARTKMVKNLKLDTKALELKKINLESKIRNANTYLNEIDMHKKSIFEFWKFTNKDELPSLNEGEMQEEKAKEKLEKTFNYEEDIEDFGMKMDEFQRRKLSKNETDAIFAIKRIPNCFNILNNTRIRELSDEQKDFFKETLKNLQNEYQNSEDVVKEKDFGIFGGMLEDITKIKTIDNKKHREIEKDVFKILNVSSQTELEVFIDNIKNYLKLIKEAMHKINSAQELPIYFASNEQLNHKSLQIFNLNQNKAIENMLSNDIIYLYKIRLKEGTPILYYSNIIFYDNHNQTLPLGMNLSDEVLIDLNHIKLTETNKTEFKISIKKNELENKIIKIIITEYVT